MGDRHLATVSPRVAGTVFPGVGQDKGQGVIGLGRHPSSRHRFQHIEAHTATKRLTQSHTVVPLVCVYPQKSNKEVWKAQNASNILGVLLDEPAGLSATTINRVRGGGLRSAILRNFAIFHKFPQFFAISRNFPQFSAIAFGLSALCACWCPLPLRTTVAEQ